MNGEIVVSSLRSRIGDVGLRNCNKNGCWELSIPIRNADGAFLEVCFQRFVGDRSSALVWHARVQDMRRCPDSKTSHSYLFMSADERLLGRCATVQMGQDVFKTSNITIVDSRLTAQRVCTLIGSLMLRLGSSWREESADHAIKSVMISWPSVPEPLPPNLRRLASDAPGPVCVEAGSSVTFAAGRICVIVGNAETVDRAHDFDKLNVNDYDDDATYSPLLRACGPHARSAELVLLVSQHGTFGYSNQVVDGVDFYAFSGVPLSWILLQAHMLHKLPHFVCVVEMFEQCPGIRCLIDAQAKKNRYNEAVDTIRAFMVSDAAVRSAKRVAWRPQGRLVRRMMEGS